MSSRRDFLKMTGLAGAAGFAYMARSPHELLARTMIRNAFVMGEAAEAQVAPSKAYVNIMMFGGPLRYTFDHWLRASASDPAMMFNSTTGTAFTYNASTRQVTGTEYRTFNHNGVLIPQLFAALSSSDRNAFMDSFLAIRGYGSGIDGHGQNSSLQMQPLAGAASLSGIVADQSQLSYKSIQTPARGAASKFLSENSVGQSILNGNDPVADLLSPLSAVSTARTLRSTYACRSQKIGSKDEYCVCHM
ncbi:MAG: twin-arginine translocation signal domain-containing protein [Cytophagaceae bacterium]|nr:MAG: twin-arginine translocation signal domain-containing protein [Cytophagaceae bacterium]